MELERLIQAEQRNEERLRAAREEAAALLLAAREEAGMRERALATDVASLVEQGRVALDAGCEHRVAEIAAQASAVVARYDAISRERIAALVPHLTHRLLAGEAGP